MPRATTSRRLSRRTAAVTLAAALAVVSAGAGPADAAGTPPLPACAVQLPLPGTLGKPVPPHPLPAPASSVGGKALSLPGLQVSPAAGKPRPPAVPAASWLVADLNTGRVIASCNAHVPFPPASTLKMLTAVTVLPDIADRRAIFTARPEDANMEGTRVGLVPGSKYSVDDLFHGLFLASGNDTAHALASYAGGEPATAVRMQVMAHQLGAADTHVVNASGLDEPGQVSSAYDLALFGRAAMANPYIAVLTGSTHYRFPGKGTTFGPERPRFDIQNQNRLLGAFAGMTGVKTGYTTLARGTYVGTAVRAGHGYLVSVMQANGGGYKSARELLNWAFTAGSGAAAVGTLVDGPPPGDPPSPTLSPSPASTTTKAAGGDGSTAMRQLDAAPAVSRLSLSPDTAGALAAILAGLLVAALLSVLWWRRRA